MRRVLDMWIELTRVEDITEYVRCRTWRVPRGTVIRFRAMSHSKYLNLFADGLRIRCRRHAEHEPWTVDEITATGRIPNSHDEPTKKLLSETWSRTSAELPDEFAMIADEYLAEIERERLPK